MASIFNRKNKNQNIVPESKQFDAGYILQESQQATTNGHLAYNFISGIRSVDSNYVNNDLLIEKMVMDPVIAAALDIWTEDALQRDPMTGEIFSVEIETPGEDPVQKKLSEGLVKRLDKLLKIDLNLEKYLASYTKRILKYGNCIIKLDFADKLVDERLELKESSVSVKRFTEIAKKTEVFLEATGKSFIDPIKVLNNTTGKLNEEFEVDLEKYAENFSTPKPKSLKEEILVDNKTVRGRWYTEIIGHGTNLYELSSKQKVIAYIDRDSTNKFMKPNSIINFSNDTGKHRVLFEIGDIQEDLDKKEYYQLQRGESFLENAMVAWQVLSALEDILLLTRMTRSILYRIFSIEVGNKGNKETAQILTNLKNRLKIEETVNIRDKIYSSSLSQVPLADSIFIPTHNGVGVTDVKTVGGDVNLKDAIDLDYFRDKLHSALRIPAPYLSYTESLPGGIGDSSLTRMDIRYSRTISRIQSILADGMRDICLRYLELTIGKKALAELPRFKIRFTSINSAEDASRAELQQLKLKTLSESLEALKALGIDIGTQPERYKKTREELVTQYFGGVLLDTIREDEKIFNVSTPDELQNTDDSQGEGPNLEFGSEAGGGGVGGPSLDDEGGTGFEPNPVDGPAPGPELGGDEPTTNELS